MPFLGVKLLSHPRLPGHHPGHGWEEHRPGFIACLRQTEAEAGKAWRQKVVVSKNVEVDGSSLGKFLCGSSVQTLCRADQGPEDQDSQSWQPNAGSFLCACASACRSPTRRSPESWPWELSREHDDLRALVNQFMYPKTPEQLLLQLQKLF